MQNVYVCVLRKTKKLFGFAVRVAASSVRGLLDGSGGLHSL